MKKKNKKFNTVAIIGPSGIGSVHLREIIKTGTQNIALVGRKFKRERIDILSKNNKEIKIDHISLWSHFIYNQIL